MQIKFRLKVKEIIIEGDNAILTLDNDVTQHIEKIVLHDQHIRVKRTYKKKKKNWGGISTRKRAKMVKPLVMDTSKVYSLSLEDITEMKKYLKVWIKQKRLTPDDTSSIKDALRVRFPKMTQVQLDSIRAMFYSIRQSQSSTKEGV